MGSNRENRSDTNYLVRCFKNNNFEDKVYHHNMIKTIFSEGEDSK